MRATRRGPAASAQVLVVMMGLAWGFNWVAARFILQAVPPWTMRAIGISIGALTLYIAAKIARVPLTLVPRDRLRVLIAGFFNVAAFGVGSAYAQVYGTTSRAIVIAYSMPIWSALLAYVVLKEKLDALKICALLLCCGGLTILIWPLARDGFPLGALIALCSAWSWAAGTIYLKWSPIEAPTLASALWQVLFGWLMLAAGAIWFEGVPHLASLQPSTIAWLAYNGFIGMGLAYFLWFVIIDRLPAMTASLGSLLVPVFGVIGSAWLVGERPTFADAIGFACIFAAAGCVLLQPNVKHVEMPE